MHHGNGMAHAIGENQNESHVDYLFFFSKSVCALVVFYLHNVQQARNNSIRSVVIESLDSSFTASWTRLG
jgi:hypothetical protein